MQVSVFTFPAPASKRAGDGKQTVVASRQWSNRFSSPIYWVCIGRSRKRGTNWLTPLMATCVTTTTALTIPVSIQLSKILFNIKTHLEKRKLPFLPSWVTKVLSLAVVNVTSFEKHSVKSCMTFCNICQKHYAVKRTRLFLHSAMYFYQIAPNVNVCNSAIIFLLVSDRIRMVDIQQSWILCESHLHHRAVELWLTFNTTPDVSITGFIQTDFLCTIGILTVRSLLNFWFSMFLFSCFHPIVPFGYPGFPQFSNVP